jgi:hypothetical protein
MLAMSAATVSASSPCRRILVGPLAATQVEQAFPLVQSLLSGIGIAAWRDFAASAIQGPPSRRGILVARETDACLLGLAVYEMTDDLRHGRVARIDPLVAADLVDPAIVAGALLREVEIAAARQGCAAVAVALVVRRSEMRRWLMAAGYADGAELLLKRIPRLTSSGTGKKSRAIRPE